MSVSLRIYTCPEWGAEKPKSSLTVVGKAHGFIFHHTASHHHEITPPADDNLEEAFRYARDIQHFHMYDPKHMWLDSGHNFLVTRGGHVLQGRWLTVSTIEAHQMVLSAHCPGFNTWIGIEHEHIHGEKMTTAQFNASARLHAWCADQYGYQKIMRVDPHSAHYNTECPDNLKAAIPQIVAAANKILSGV